MMKTALYSLVLSISFFPPAHADLTIVQKVEGIGAPTDMTIKIKGDKARIEAAPQITTIVDGKTGEVINLMNKEKTVVRISPDKVKAVTDMIKKFNTTKEGAEKAKLNATGQKETVNGYETEQYTYDGPEFKATYWIASNYPDGAAILAQLQSINSDFWNAANTKMPDYRDFPGLPIRTRMTMTKQSQPTPRIRIRSATLSSPPLATLRRRSCRIFLTKKIRFRPLRRSHNARGRLSGVSCFISAGVRFAQTSRVAR